jgi:hypothetical protein
VSYVYIIGPVRSDPQYKQKRQVLADISSGYQYQFFFPFERYKSFSLDAVRTDLRNAAVVIADLSLERPSCYFELGVAQALDLPVQMIAASGTPDTPDRHARRRDLLLRPRRIQLGHTSCSGFSRLRA